MPKIGLVKMAVVASVVFAGAIVAAPGAWASTQPVLTTTPSLTGTTLKDSAVLSEGSGPTGTITFTLYNQADVLLDTETVTVSGNGTYSTPTGYAYNPAVEQTYQWDAAYSGDANNNPVSDLNDPAEQVTVEAVLCTPGSYSTTGVASCTLAPAGSYDAGTGNTSATPCPAGTYSSTSGNVSCTLAPAGSYDAGTGNTSATLCPSGAISAAGATACTATTTLGYSGTDQVATGSSFTPTASLSSPAASCESGQPVSFSMSADPLNGTAGTYNLGTATNSSSTGLVTGSAVSTSGWENGVYVITVSYVGATVGATICAPATTTASLAVTSPGQLAFGAGWYTVPSVGATSFGFAVALSPHSTSTYVGQLNVITPGKWWFQANVTSYGKTGTTQGLLAGAGSLYSWNSTLNKGHGGWQLIKSGVTYNATANAATKTSPSGFGIALAYSPTSGQPALPNSSPIPLIRGGIFIA